MQRARLLKSGALHPFRNMALDEALDPEPPVLRLYRFDPPGLSLGYFQAAADFDAATIARLGAVLVRRATGGAAILHAHDVTFAFVARADHAVFAGPIAESYRRVHEAIALGLAELGVQATARGGDDRGAARPDDPVCFHAPTSFDLVVAGRKLVGSAQRRTRDRVLHHGSIPIAKNALATDASSIEDVLGRRPRAEEVEDALARGFERAFGFAFERGEPTATESARAEELARTKYGTAEWNSSR